MTAESYGEALIVDDLALLELGERSASIYRSPVGMRKLYEHPDSGAVHLLVRYPPGLEALAHRHSSAHTAVVLQGSLRVNDRVIGPGGYAHLPAGEVMFHTNAGDDPCLFLLMFDGPVDAIPMPS